MDKVKKRINLPPIILTILMLTSIITSLSIAKGIPQNQHKNSILKNKTIPNNIIILLLDHTDFSCQFCLSSFLQLCDTLQNRNLPNSIIWGILDVGNNKDTTAKKKYIQVLKKQLRGFVNGNNIKFPFILDSSHVFEKLINDGSTLIILNRTSGETKQWHIPSKQNDISDIFNFIFNN